MALTNKKNNRLCIVCNCSYYHCGHCDEPIKPSWYNIFHDQNCHDIYDAVANIYPEKGKAVAKEALDKLDLSNKENFHQNIVKLINEIYDINDVDVENNIVDNKIEIKENIETKTKTKIKVEDEAENKEQVGSKVETQPEVKVEEKNETNIKTNSSTQTVTQTSNQGAKKVSRNIKNKK